jgi:hypothetical protein
MPPELEKIVPSPDALDAEYLRPNARYGFFRLTQRGLEFA